MRVWGCGAPALATHRSCHILHAEDDVLRDGDYYLALLHWLRGVKAPHLAHARGGKGGVVMSGRSGSARDSVGLCVAPSVNAVASISSYDYIS